jgi:hypothetical protein
MSIPSFVIKGKESAVASISSSLLDTWRYNYTAVFSNRKSCALAFVL